MFYKLLIISLCSEGVTFMYLTLQKYEGISFFFVVKDLRHVCELIKDI